MYPSIAGVSGSTLYSRSELDKYKSNDSEILQDLSAFEFPRENLKFIEKLGEGQFGEVGLSFVNFRIILIDITQCLSVYIICIFAIFRCIYVKPIGCMIS